MTDRVELGPLDDDPSNTVKVTGPTRRGDPMNPPLEQEWVYPAGAQEVPVELESTGGYQPREVQHVFLPEPEQHGLLRKPRGPLDVRREALDNAQVGIDSARNALAVALDWLAIDDPATAADWEKKLLPELDNCVEGVARRRKALDA